MTTENSELEMIEPSFRALATSDLSTVSPGLQSPSSGPNDSPAVPHLLTLPQEIRSTIYQYLLDYHAGLGNAGVLRANRQIHDEITEFRMKTQVLVLVTMVTSSDVRHRLRAKVSKSLRHEPSPKNHNMHISLEDPTSSDHISTRYMVLPGYNSYLDFVQRLMLDVNLQDVRTTPTFRKMSWIFEILPSSPAVERRLLSTIRESLWDYRDAQVLIADTALARDVEAHIERFRWSSSESCIAELGALVGAAQQEFDRKNLDNAGVKAHLAYVTCVSTLSNEQCFYYWRHSHDELYLGRLYDLQVKASIALLEILLTFMDQNDIERVRAILGLDLSRKDIYYVLFSIMPSEASEDNNMRSWTWQVHARCSYLVAKAFRIYRELEKAKKHIIDALQSDPGVDAFRVESGRIDLEEYKQNYREIVRALNTTGQREVITQEWDD